MVNQRECIFRKEFSRHAELSEKLKVACYFANPYSSWERGLKTLLHFRFELALFGRF
jgi:hypothetical protein